MNISSAAFHSEGLFGLKFEYQTQPSFHVTRCLVLLTARLSLCSPAELTYFKLSSFINIITLGAIRVLTGPAELLLLGCPPPLLLSLTVVKCMVGYLAVPSQRNSRLTVDAVGKTWNVLGRLGTWNANSC